MKLGKVYIAEDGTRFLIHAKKNRPSSNGCDYIGENLKTGLVTHFNHKGLHPVVPEWQLKVDPYRWCGVHPDGTVAEGGFVPVGKLTERFEGYLRMENDTPSTIIYVTRAGLEKTYV